jgi:hypothetical protein
LPVSVANQAKPPMNSDAKPLGEKLAAIG